MTQIQRAYRPGRSCSRSVHHSSSPVAPVLTTARRTPPLSARRRTAPRSVHRPAASRAPRHRSARRSAPTLVVGMPDPGTDFSLFSLASPQQLRNLLVKLSMAERGTVTVSGTVHVAKAPGSTS